MKDEMPQQDKFKEQIAGSWGRLGDYELGFYPGGTFSPYELLWLLRRLFLTEAHGI